MRTLVCLLGLVLALPAVADGEPDYSTAPAPCKVTLTGMSEDEKVRKALAKYAAGRLRGASVVWKEGLVFTVPTGRKVTLAQLRAVVRAFGKAKKLKGLKITDVEMKGFVDVTIKLDKKPHPDKVFALTLQVQSMEGVRIIKQGRDFSSLQLICRAPGTSIDELDTAVIDALGLEDEDKKSVVAAVWNGPPKGKKKRR